MIGDISENVFDLLEEQDSVERYQFNWSNPRVRDYLQRLGFIATYGVTIDKDKDRGGYTCKVMKIGYRSDQEEMYFSGNTIGDALDSARNWVKLETRRLWELERNSSSGGENLTLENSPWHIKDIIVLWATLGLCVSLAVAAGFAIGHYFH